MQTPKWLMLVCGLLACMTMARPLCADQPLQVKYIATTPNANETYFIELIDAALSHSRATSGRFEIHQRYDPLATKRKLQMLSDGELVNVSWLPLDANPGPREHLLRIDIPIMRGLLGYRVAIVKPGNKDLFSHVHSLEQLRKFRLGQGKDWADVEIYRHNNMEVFEALNVLTLFRMLIADRYDFVPLGVTEVDEEVSAYADQGAELVIEPHLLIYYPFPVYFYVSPNAPELATRLRQGLQIMVANGEFETLFDQHFAPILNALKINQRQLIKLSHPYFDAALLEASPALWYRPATEGPE